MRETEATTDARRAMEVCNACRYCEGFCAVFPAMTMRREFSTGDLSYIANLCHNCKGCYYACQYAPPHPFNINVPQVLAQVRAETYEEYAWPGPLAGLFKRNGTVVSLATAGVIALTLLMTMALVDPSVLYQPQIGPGAFYRVIPWWLMVTLAGGTSLFALVALAMGFRNFWRDTGGRADELQRAKPLAVALHDILTLKNLGGGGGGCNDKDEAFSQLRRRFHHFMFYGFMLCFASTTTATFYDHIMGHPAPYPFWSLPVQLGTWGGVGMVIGTAGLIWVKIVSDPAPAARNLLGADYALLVLLFLSAFTGLLLLAFRSTGAMGVMLAVHLGVIFALFLLVPYSKMVHAVYRSAALLRHALERHPTPPPGNKPSDRALGSAA
ncbi:tricarballylate utilization 4Fe-4S protein TcuB [Roseomonas xinghualingensis]|uniref:tricarballylate utilization 4Fe-4S protein TcuB n=1 Tax=Roseomonas xinghualingensis TaxID=2986475 RepID=UPI0021F131A5|nr:tricarballylate utilization 4Fe-4S protein TcuB [Roseomonas sp. SXEYE001]MCV4207185.1 tricarballylate utilization 4Fe-4S protein TcuB [Roseomonas sp. SXEYE001]